MPVPDKVPVVRQASTARRPGQPVDSDGHAPTSKRPRHQPINGNQRGQQTSDETDQSTEPNTYVIRDNTKITVDFPDHPEEAHAPRITYDPEATNLPDDAHFRRNIAIPTVVAVGQPHRPRLTYQDSDASARSARKANSGQADISADVAELVKPDKVKEMPSTSGTRKRIPHPNAGEPKIQTDLKIGATLAYPDDFIHYATVLVKPIFHVLGRFANRAGDHRVQTLLILRLIQEMFTKPDTPLTTFFRNTFDLCANRLAVDLLNEGAELEVHFANGPPLVIRYGERHGILPCVNRGLPRRVVFKSRTGEQYELQRANMKECEGPQLTDRKEWAYFRVALPDAKTDDAKAVLFRVRWYGCKKEYTFKQQWSELERVLRNYFRQNRQAAEAIAQRFKIQVVPAATENPPETVRRLPEPAKYAHGKPRHFRHEPQKKQ